VIRGLGDVSVSLTDGAGASAGVDGAGLVLETAGVGDDWSSRARRWIPDVDDADSTADADADSGWDVGDAADVADAELLPVVGGAAIGLGDVEADVWSTAVSALSRARCWIPDVDEEDVPDASAGADAVGEVDGVCGVSGVSAGSTLGSAGVGSASRSRRWIPGLESLCCAADSGVAIGSAGN